MMDSKKVYLTGINSDLGKLDTIKSKANPALSINLKSNLDK